jgi:gliding motility-associated-like protein
MDSLTRNNLVTATDPVPQFSSADTLSCPGGTVRFSNTSTPAGFSSRWDFGDGNTSTALSPNHSYNNTGIYSVKLVIRDAYGCADSVTKTQFIRVDDPLAAFTASDTVSSCIPFEVHFTNSSTYFRSVAWSFGPGEGGSTQTNPTHYFNQPGVYPVKLVVTSPGGCKDSITRNIYLYDTAGTRLNYLPASGCSPIPASISVTTTGPINGFVWDFGDGNTATTTSPSVNYIYTGYGSFVPRLVLQDPTGCLIPLQGLDTFHVTGSKPHFGMDSSVFCDRGLVRFSDSTTSNDPVIRYHWQFGDGGTSSLQHPQHSYASPGLYNVRLIVETQNGCIDTSIRTNTVRVVQRPLIDITGDTSVCVGSSLSHRGRFLQPDTSVVSWSWSFPNGNSSYQQDPAQQPYPAAGSFQIRAIATNSTGCQDTTYHPVHVRPYPTATIPAQIAVQNGFPVPIPATFSANTTSWIWSPATGLSCTNCPNPLAGPRYETRYQVAFSDAYGCVSRASVLVQMFCKNVNLFIPNTFSPNGDGSNDVFYLRGTGLDRVKTLRIFNRWGEVVFEKRDVPINDPTAGWNGLFRGRPAVADVYVYQAEAYCENGELIKLNGNIALIL